MKAELNISEAQMGQFTQLLRGRFERRLAGHLRERFPEKLATVADDRLLPAVHYFCDQASGHGIELENDVRRFAELMLSYGRGMASDAQYPWIGQTLRQEGLSGTEKVDLLDILELEFMRKSP